MTTSNPAICLHFKFGHCKYGEKCRMKHILAICKDDICEVQQCEKRHQRQCRYFSQYGRCKFSTYCSYLHVTKPDDAIDVTPMKHDIFKLTENVVSLEMVLESKESHLHSLETEIKLLKEENEKQQLEIENIVTTFKKHIEEAIQKTT